MIVFLFSYNLLTYDVVLPCGSSKSMDVFFCGGNPPSNFHNLRISDLDAGFQKRACVFDFGSIDFTRASTAVCQISAMRETFPK